MEVLRRIFLLTNPSVTTGYPHLYTCLPVLILHILSPFRNSWAAVPRLDSLGFPRCPRCKASVLIPIHV